MGITFQGDFWTDFQSKPRQLAAGRGPPAPSGRALCLWPPDLGNGSVFEGSLKAWRRTTYRFMQVDPIVKGDDSLIKLVFCLANCTNFILGNEGTPCDWDSHSLGPGGVQGTLVPLRQPPGTVLPLAQGAGLSEPSLQQAWLIGWYADQGKFIN